MLKINRKVEYGLIALKYMVNKPLNELSSVREICDLFGAPFDPVAHVMRIMTNNGLIESEQGAHGGYRLVNDLTGISFYQYMEMIEGNLAFTDCIRDDCRCSMVERCNIISPMKAFHLRFSEFLRSVPLTEMLQIQPSEAMMESRPGFDLRLS